MIGIASVALAVVGTTDASAAESSTWQQYLLTPPAHPKPLKVMSVSRNVTNAAALVSGEGAATLTATADGKRPQIVLDYGQELGGIPDFSVRSVTGIGAAPVQLHSAFSETRQYLFTPAATTLSATAAAGSHGVHVASVSDFIVGDTVAVGSGPGAERSRITKVGSAPLATTLTYPAAAGDSGVKIAGVGTLVPGDTLQIGAETGTIASVGTGSTSTTLAADAAAGDTVITVGSASGFLPGDMITVGSDTGTVASVTPGFPTSTITLTAPLASAQANGADVADPGSGITLTSPLTSAHVVGEDVSSAGSGLMLDRPLTANHPTGEAVTSSPGAATGDYTPSGPGNSVDISVGKRGRYTARRVGGFRYQEIELDSPGTISLTRTGITFDAYRATASTYQGHFSSSSAELNKMYYAGAYSTQMNMLPASTTGANPTGGAQLLDGAKRDQRIWSGDLLAEIATMESTLGSNAAPYIKSDLQYLIDNADPTTGELASVGQFLYYSLSYSMDTALAAVEYYRYSDDRAFAAYALPALRNELGYLSQHIDDNGLLVTTGNGFEGMDWAFDNGPSVGEVSYFNMLYYHLLTEMNYLESHVGSSAQGTGDLQLADSLRTRINDKLYSSSLNSYVYTDAKPDVIPQDADVVSVLWGIAPPDQITTILNTVKTQLWRERGTAPWSDNAGFRDVMSPYITGFEVDARFASGDSADALTLLDRMWGYMLHSPLFNGTFWEELQYDGSLWNGAHDSLAHGWSSGPTYQSTQYILGVQPVEPGYKTWTVAPHPSGLRWAKGTVPTSYGPITVTWRDSASGFDLTVHAPAGTSGTVAMPGASAAVAVRGGSTRVLHVQG